MVYKVSAVHSWNLHLGVVEYMTGGEDFAILAKSAIGRFPKMKFDLPIGTLDEDALYGVLYNTMTAYLANFQLEEIRPVQRRATDFLKTIDAEYRRWKFEEAMDLGSVSGIMEDLVPLIKLYKANASEGASLEKTVKEYCSDVLSVFFSEAVVEEFADAVELFLTRYKGKVTGLKLTLDFPKCQYHLMDMKLLIDVSEE